MHRGYQEKGVNCMNGVTTLGVHIVIR